VITQLTLFSNIVFNGGGLFSSNAWTPPAGKIRIGGSFRSTGVNVTSTGAGGIYLYKNGSLFQQYNIVQQSGDTFRVGIWAEDVAVGTDVYTLRCLVTQAGNTTVSGVNADTNFWGYTLPT
jgi:hypothetical protein